MVVRAVITLLILGVVAYFILSQPSLIEPEDFDLPRFTTCGENRVVDDNGVCRTVNTNQDAFDDCANEALLGTPGYEVVPIPAQDESGNLLDPDEFLPAIIQCNLPDGTVVHAGIVL